MNARELLQRLETMEMTPDSMYALAVEVKQSNLSGIMDVTTKVAPIAAKRALEIRDEGTMAGLMTIVITCGLLTARELVRRS